MHPDDAPDVSGCVRCKARPSMKGFAYYEKGFSEMLLRRALFAGAEIALQSLDLAPWLETSRFGIALGLDVTLKSAILCETFTIRLEYLIP